MSLLGKEWYGEFIAHKDGFKEGVEEGFKVGYETAKKEFADRKTGKWIKDTYGNVICSECRANRRDNRIGHIAFCNSCGAKMEVEE